MVAFHESVYFIRGEVSATVFVACDGKPQPDQASRGTWMVFAPAGKGQPIVFGEASAVGWFAQDTSSAVR